MGVLCGDSKRVIVVIIEGDPYVFIKEWVLINLTILDISVGSWCRILKLQIEQIVNLLSREDNLSQGLVIADRTIVF